MGETYVALATASTAYAYFRWTQFITWNARFGII